MKLLTEELKRTLPKIGQQDNVKDPVAHVKFFCPWNSWTWYLLEFDGRDLCFGYVAGDFPEYGSFLLSELESVKMFGLGIERDLHFKPTPMSKIINGGQ